MEANNGRLAKHTYEGVDTMLDHGTGVRKERNTKVNSVVAGGRALGGFQFSQT